MDERTDINWSLLDNAAQFVEWLRLLGRDNDQAIDRLSRWVEGRSLEASDEDTEPYKDLYRLAVSLRETASLAMGVKKLLELWARGEWKSTPKSRYNILRLCTELRDDQRLGEVVWHLYRNRLVEGSYLLALRLTNQLLGAMIHNQPPGDQEPLMLWNQILRGQPDEYVGGVPLDGFRGIARREPSEDGLIFAWRALFLATEDRALCADQKRYVVKAYPDRQVENLWRRVRLDDIEASLTDFKRNRRELIERVCSNFLGEEQAIRQARWNDALGTSERKLRALLVRNVPRRPSERFEIRRQCIPDPREFEDPHDRHLALSAYKEANEQIPGTLLTIPSREDYLFERIVVPNPN